MAKKLLWLPFVAVLLLLAGWLVYWKMARVAPRKPGVASNWPSSLPATPPAPTPGPTAHPRAESLEKKEAPPAEPIFSLRPGESLDYDANITKLNSTVAHLKISAIEKRSTGNRSTWHLQAMAHTENPYRMVFELDDQFDSYSDAATMTGIQYEMHLSERGQKVESVQRLLHNMQEPVPPDVSAARVLPGTRDPLGMLQFLRGVDWAHTAEARSPVWDGHKLYDVRAVLIGRAVRVSVPAGNFSTLKIEIHVLDNGAEMKDAHFVLYLANDETRLPVLMEAVLPVATARVELTKSK